MRTKDDAENAGYDAAISGPNTTNCHFTLFATPELKDAWERGNAKGKKCLAEWEAEADLADGDGL